MIDGPFIDPEWETILENAKEQNKTTCRHMLETKVDGHLLHTRCRNKAKYVIEPGPARKSIAYPACPKHAQELREKPDAIVRPMNPKLDIFT